MPKIVPKRHGNVPVDIQRNLETIQRKFGCGFFFSCQPFEGSTSVVALRISTDEILSNSLPKDFEGILSLKKIGRIVLPILEDLAKT